MSKKQKKGFLKTALIIGFGAAVATTLALTGFALIGSLGEGIAALLIAASVTNTVQSWALKKKQRKEYNALYPGIPLTTGESVFIKSIFGRKMSNRLLKRLRKHMKPESKENVDASVPGGDTRRIDFHGPENHEEDYSHPKNAGSYGLFIHEVTHIWQNKRLTAEFRRIHASDSLEGNKKYEYTLSEKTRFRSLAKEQQAALIQDYAQRFLNPQEDMPALWIQNKEDKDALIKKVVERKFHAARKARLKVASFRKQQAAAQP